MNNAANLKTHTITVNTDVELGLSTSRSYFMVVNNDADDLVVKLGSNTSNGFTVVANGGHYLAECGILGPIFLSSASSIDVEVVSAVNETDLIQ